VLKAISNRDGKRIPLACVTGRNVVGQRHLFKREGPVLVSGVRPAEVNRGDVGARVGFARRLLGFSERHGILHAMSEDRPYIEENTRERERLRALVERLNEDELRLPVNPHWTVAAVFGHIAFWDGRVLGLADKLDRGEPFTSSDAEPEDVDWINDASRPLIHAIPPREAARLALQIAEETDARVATLPPDRLWPRDPDSPLYAVRAAHRGEHLDEVEAALRTHDGHG
jgi:DinB family protein